MLERYPHAALRFRAAAVLLTLVAVALLALLTTRSPPPTTIATGDAGVRVPARVSAAPTPLLRAPTPAANPTVRLLAEGRASYYGPGLEGNRTASGEVFRSSALTAAHRTLPFGARVRVTNLRTGKAVVVRINDRGPFVGNRVIDLSREAAKRIGMLRRGTDPVRIELLPGEAEA